MTPKQISQVAFLWDSSLPHLIRAAEPELELQSYNVNSYLLSTALHLPILLLLY